MTEPSIPPPDTAPAGGGRVYGYSFDFPGAPVVASPRGADKR